MPFLASEIEIPEKYLRDMLADCQTWRAIVANPAFAWSELIALIDAGGIPEGDAATQIQYGSLNDDEENGRVLKPPRAVIRKFDEDQWQRMSSSGFSLAGGLTITFELRVPPGSARYVASDRYEDVRRKMEAIAAELRSLPRQAGYADLINVACGPVMDFDPTESDHEFIGSEINVQHAGAD